ncbi:MAG: carboxypeptidase-like regulatory domain-containing protein [Planctomycetes bacterium]|nr:carboxypeptidase-like regulatory domain-containing protein [Planctomycetota bacterium]
MARSRLSTGRLAALLVALASCVGTALREATPPSTGQHLIGRVVTTDGRPIEGATLEARTYAGRGLAVTLAKELDADGTVVARATSDSDGRFALSIAVRGAVDVLVSKRGLANSVLEARLPGDELECVLAEPATLTGVVRERTRGTPIAGASVDLFPIVEWFPRSRAHATMTASDGSFRFADLPPGAVRAQVRAPGFSHAAAGRYVELHANARSTVDFELTRCPSARVRVVDHTSGKSIVGATIGAFTATSRAITDADGWATVVGD